MEEVEVLLADSTIVRASQSQNPDLFWALKGAAAGFGVITELVVLTEPEPSTMVRYAYSFTLGTYKTLVNSFMDWQKFASDPNLTRVSRRHHQFRNILRLQIRLRRSWYRTNVLSAPKSQRDCLRQLARARGALGRRRCLEARSIRRDDGRIADLQHHEPIPDNVIE